MLSDKMREFLLNGPQGQKKDKALLALGGSAHVRVAWRRHRERSDDHADGEALLGVLDDRARVNPPSGR